MIDFKPQNLGIPLDRFIRTDEIKSAVVKTLNQDTKHNIAEPQTKEYMKYLLDSAIGKTPKLSVNPKNIPQAEINSVKKDFGEIIGAVEIVAKRELFKTLKIDQSSTIFFPRRGNEPLMDYKIKSRDKEYKISAKAGTKTNTVKPNDILNLINSNPTLLRQVGGSTEYKVLSFLNEGTMVSGVLMAAGQLFQDRKATPTKDMNMDKLRMNFEYAQKIGDAAFKNKFPQFVIDAEKVVVNWSRQANLKELILTAISGVVFYLKLENLDSEWKPKWQTIGEIRDEDIRKLNVVAFRSKNSVSRDSKGNVRISDKLGLQM